MAQALAAGIAKNNRELEFVIADPSESARQAFQIQIGAVRTRVLATNRDVYEACETVFLAVKPQYVAAALADLKVGDVCRGERSVNGFDLDSPNLRPLVVSVMAGISIARITQLTGATRVIRVMPNTPCLIGFGACAMAVSPSVSQSDESNIRSYLESVGVLELVAEPLLDAVTGLSGSGPAYVFSFIESLVMGAVKMGLPQLTAEKLAVQTVLGAAKMLQESSESPAELRDRVTSPGGTTLAGLKELEVLGFRNAVMSAVQAATARSVELGQQF